jgi:AcrR family transcriptional regulator
MQKTRREEKREETIMEIKDLAWQQMADQGPANLSLRAISRDMRMSSAAIFRYFEDRNALLMALSLDAYQAQIDAVAVAAAEHSGDQPDERLLAAITAYRAWALKKPEQFMLIYGANIPGFEPDWNEIVPVATKNFALILDLMQDAWEAGLLSEPEMNIQLPQELKRTFEATAHQREYPAAAEALYLAVSGWIRVHGLISLEILGQLKPLIGDASQLFDFEIRRFLMD